MRADIGHLVNVLRANDDAFSKALIDAGQRLADAWATKLDAEIMGGADEPSESFTAERK
jgi:hypothetical protein